MIDFVKSSKNGLKVYRQSIDSQILYLFIILHLWSADSESRETPQSYATLKEIRHDYQAFTLIYKCHS